MKLRRLFPCVGLWFGLQVTCSADANIPDVPQNHWARSSVYCVVSTNVLPLIEGKFNGANKVDRRDLAIALAAFGKALEAGKWPRGSPKPLSTKLAGKPAGTTEISRYQLAAVLDRVGRLFMERRPNPGSKRFGASTALQPPIDLKMVSPSDRALPALKYLVKNHMMFGKAILATSGTKPVTSDQLAIAVSMVVAGAIDKLTDEPEMREPLDPRPARK